MKVKVTDSLYDTCGVFPSIPQGMAYMNRRRSEIISERKRDEPSEELYWERVQYNWTIVHVLVIDKERSGIKLTMEVA